MSELPTKREVAETYVQKQLATMDGSFDAALKRIGTDKYEELVQKIMKITRTGYGPERALAPSKDSTPERKS